MHKNNFHSIFALANTLYGTVLDESVAEDIAMVGWEQIGNRETRLYRYSAPTVNRRLELPCNADIIEAVYSSDIDFQQTSPELNHTSTNNQYVESYVESFNTHKSTLYNTGTLLKYRQEGGYLVFDRDYANVTILYHGVIVDEDGLPYITDKELQALAAYCAYSDLYKQSLIRRDPTSMQLAAAIKTDWLRLCNAARIPMHFSQNEMNDILDVKTRWDRKQYGKSFKPVR